MKTDQLKQMPKVELHCHLDGSLSPGLIRSLLGRSISDSELMVAPECRSLAEYLEKFSLPLSCMQTVEGLRLAGYDFIRSCAEENVCYAEVRFAPQFSRERGLSEREVIQAVLDGLEQGKKEFGVEYGVIVCAMRHLPEEENLAMLRTASEFLGKGVCAADLAGNEAAYPMSEFMRLFEQVAAMGMPFTLHAGECGSAQNIRDAIAAGAKRIGHGIAMRGDAALQNLCREREIGVELCPHSNLQTRAVASESEYPLIEFLQAGLPVTLNTDNRTVSGCTLTDEYAFVQKEWSVTDAQLWQMTENAVRVSFADQKTKAHLLEKIQAARMEAETR